VIASVVNTTTIGKVALYSLIAGVGIAVVFGVGVSSAAELLDALRQRRNVAGAAWGLLAATCSAVVVGAIVLGIVVMSSKR
jgi:hypothetical protein